MNLNTFLVDLLSTHGIDSAGVQILEDNAKVCTNTRSSSSRTICDEPPSRGLSNRWASSDCRVVAGDPIRWEGAKRQQSDSCLTAPRWEAFKRQQSDSCLTAPRRRTSRENQHLVNSIATMSFLGQRSSPTRGENANGNSNETWNIPFSKDGLREQDKESLGSLMEFFDEGTRDQSTANSTCTVPPKLPPRSRSLSARTSAPQKQLLSPQTLETLRIRTKVFPITPYVDRSSRTRSAGIIRDALGSLAPPGI